MKIISEDFDLIEHFFRDQAPESNELHLLWLGQAGFALNYSGKRMLIDPYLSDYLSKKYKGTLFPHVRLMEIPIEPEKLRNIDYVFCSHPHSDHMDPETLTTLSKNNPSCKFVVPSAEIEEAIRRGVNEDQLLSINVKQKLKLSEKILVDAIPAAHETFKINDKNEHSFLGFIFTFNGIKLYHSGDCIPYDGLAENLKRLHVDIALLPINGRDEYRLKNAIAGNFKIQEVLDLCKQAEITHLIVHHFGMFAYNTVTEEDLRYLETQSTPSLKIIVPRIKQEYKIIDE